MKKRTKTIIILSCLCGAALALGLSACAGPETHENNISSLLKRGKDVIVYYEKNGGIFSADENVEVFDAYSYEQLERKGGVKLLAPGDPLRDGGGDGGNNATTSTATRSGYTLIGWYRERNLRTNEDGDPLDDEGNLCYITDPATGQLVSEAGKPQGYSYSNEWDFDNELLRTSDLESETVGKKTLYSIHLYAAWAPNCVYEFYQKTEETGTWQAYGTAIKPVSLDGIDVPEWDDDKGSINYDSIPRYSIAADTENEIEGKNFTLAGIYADPECTQPFAEYDESETGGRIFEKTIPHSGVTDKENGTSTGSTVKIYTTWKEGNWFRIRTARQLSDNAMADGHYSILADIDFTGATWSFSALTFTGSFEGNGHTLSNITASQTQTTQTVYGGLFGTFTAEAHLKDIIFGNTNFTVAAGVPRDRSSEGRVMGHFGLFAGIIEEADEENTGVTRENFENVTLSGTVLVGGRGIVRNCLGVSTPGAELSSFALGLVSGNFFGEDLNGLGIKYDVTAESAIYAYGRDSHANSIYGTELKVETLETSDESGRVKVTVLDTPITIL